MRPGGYEVIVMTERPKDVFDACPHPGLEYLGQNRDARFMRCDFCGEVFVLQGGQVWAIPAVRSEEGSMKGPKDDR
jgi:hypothetical protein